MERKTKHNMSIVSFLSLGYFITITIGAILLMMPFATKEGQPPTTVIDAIFTSTSATCVTGLVTFDTFTHWTLFGQIVILCLIQIGGLGFMTIITLLFMLLKKNISLYQRTVLMQSAGSYNISGVVGLMRTIFIGTLIIESTGAFILACRFVPEMGWGQGIYYGIFHSISAFCNAGFDLMGGLHGEFSSLTAYYNDPIVNLTIAGLIAIGGLGFIVWSDVLSKKFNFKNFETHTKIVLVFNTSLVIGSMLLYLLFEFNNSKTMAGFNIGDKVLASFFMAVTPRTAGFNTINLNGLTESSKLLSMILMFIGGNPGSTAGGIKVTTMVIIVANLVSQAKNKRDIVMFKRTISPNIVQNSASLVLSYFLLIIVSSTIITVIEPYSLTDVMFEVTSALGTVGLGLGISSSTLIMGVSTKIVSKIVLILLMYSGRIGAFTLFSLVLRKQKEVSLATPEGKVLVG